MGIHPQTPARRARALVGLMLLASGVAAVGYGAAQGTDWVYYKDVDAVVRDATAGRVRVHGTVGPDVELRPASHEARFTVLGATRRLPVELAGSVPEGLAPGREVIVEGRLDAQGVLRADLVLTKCASKYQAASPGAAEVRP